MCLRLRDDIVSCVFCQIEVMHDFHGNRSCLYGPTPDTDSEAEDNPEQVTRYAIFHTWSLTWSLTCELACSCVCVCVFETPYRIQGHSMHSFITSFLLLYVKFLSLFLSFSLCLAILWRNWSLQRGSMWTSCSLSFWWGYFRFLFFFFMAFCSS